MKAQALVAYGAPLEERHSETPAPHGSEVLLKVLGCGVCHSDLHLQDGYFGLGGDRRLDVSAGRQLPFVLGHEIEGEVVALGEGVEGVAVGQRHLVFPWIGCGACSVCDYGDEHLCNKPRALGVNAPGGFATHVLVPHARYLLPQHDLPQGLGAAYMCSGLTAFSALKKARVRTPQDHLLIVGLGGVGMMALQFARAMMPNPIIVADIDAAKLAAASEAGADSVINAGDDGAAKQVLKMSNGGAAVAFDFVGAESSLKLATDAVRKGGSVIVVGMFGGAFSMPIPYFPMRAISIVGSYVGNLQEAREMLRLVSEGAVRPIPIHTRPLSEANDGLNELRQGRVVGRCVLRPGAE